MANLIHHLKEDLKNLRKKRKTVSIDLLLQYIDKNDGMSDQEWEVWRAEHSSQLAEWQQKIETMRHGERLIVESAFQALKSLMIVSGGAAVTVMALLGNVWEKGVDRIGLSKGLVCFGWSVAGGAIAYGIAYLIHVLAYETVMRRTVNTLRVLVAVVVVFCYGALGKGLLSTYHALVTHPPSNKESVTSKNVSSTLESVAPGDVDISGETREGS